MILFCKDPKTGKIQHVSWKDGYYVAVGLSDYDKSLLQDMPKDHSVYAVTDDSVSEADRNQFANECKQLYQTMNDTEAE